MRKVMAMLRGAGGVIWVLGLFLGMGCESEDSPDTGGLRSFFDDNPYASDARFNFVGDVHISPTRATVSDVGQKIVFTGTGGVGPYRWEVANPARGRVIVVAPSQGIYQAYEVASNDILCYDRKGHAAVARITASSEASSPLAILAQSTHLSADGSYTQLRVTGGTPPYTWSLGNGARGSLDHTTGDTVLYTRIQSGDNSVRCEDATGSVDLIVIVQP